MDRAKAAFYWNTLTRLPEVLAFRRNPWVPREKLLAIQLRLLKRRLTHAWEYNPLYRRLMETANLDRLDIERMTEVDDLQRFPVITKRDLSGSLGQVLSRGFKIEALIKSNTAGSTGRPLIFYLHPNERFKRRYVGVRNNMNISGCKRDDTYILLSHFKPVEENEPFHVYKTNWISQFFLNAPHRLIQVSPYRDMEFRLKILEQFQPTVIHAWVWDLYSLVKTIKKSPKKSQVHPRLSICCSGGLPEYMVAEIEEVLQTEIRFIYGCREFGDFAAQCRFGRYHLSIDAVVVECVDDRGIPVPPNVPGRLLITDLYNYVTPFIRYEIGDLGVLAPPGEPCACGLTLPILTRIDGRLADCVVDRQGHLIVPGFFWNEWRQEAGIEEGQLIQLDLDHFRLNLVVNHQFNPEVSLPRLRSVYVQKIGEVQIDFALVQELEREQSGKVRMVKSYVAGGQLIDAASV